MADSEDKTAAALKKVQIFEAVSIVVAHHCVCASRAQTLMSAKVCLLFNRVANAMLLNSL
jgi:hypothetical protein